MMKEYRDNYKREEKILIQRRDGSLKGEMGANRKEWHKRGRQAQRDMKVSLSEWLRSET